MSRQPFFFFFHLLGIKVCKFSAEANYDQTFLCLFYQAIEHMGACSVEKFENKVIWDEFHISFTDR